MRKRPYLGALIGGAVALLLFYYYRFAIQEAVDLAKFKLENTHTVESRVAEFGASVQARLAPDLRRRNISYPPSALTFIAFKDRRELEVYASNDGTGFALIRTYPILGASGDPGPKLREGDRQVPEGIYAVESLNPNSLYHLAVRVNYPNAFDQSMARLEGRSSPGTDIMIHGGTGSIGCLAMGDEAAEDLFVLCALTGEKNVKLIFCPTDFRRAPGPLLPSAPTWLPELYASIRRELSKYQAREETPTASGQP